MNLGKIIFCLALGLGSVHSEASSKLFFPVDKSQLKILPQRFEYQLLNKDQFRIGNIVMDATTIDFQILPSNDKKNHYKLRFRWPAGLLDRGEIAIKDNAGKGIWFQAINPEQITLSADKTLATYETETEVPSLLRLVQFYPFFKFCVHREEPLTKTFLCSKDLYLRKSKDKDQIVIEKRDSYRPQSFVEINGQPVGEQGVIYLNSPSEFVSLRALLLSGATIEVDTRMKKINFKDVFIADDQKTLVVRAEGSEPVDSTTMERPKDGSPDEWQTRLDVERPYTYLKGEGNLPLRQEFLLQGPLRKEFVQVSVVSGDSDLTFRDKHSLILKPAKGLRLALADKKTKLEKISSDEYELTLTDLKQNEPNRRFVKVLSGNEEYIAAYEIDRHMAFDASLRLMAPLWAQANLLYTPELNWGFTLGYDSQISKSASSDPQIQIISAGAQYHFPSGLHMTDPMSSVEIYAQSLMADSTNLTLLGIGFQGEYKSPRWWPSVFPWTFVKLRVPLMSLNSDYPVKTSLEGELSFRSPVSPSLYWEVGAKHSQFLFENNTSEIKLTRTMGFLGIGWLF